MHSILALVSCAVLLSYGVLQILIIRNDQQKTRSPVILVPGLGGSQMEAKLNKSSTVHWVCSNKTSDFYNLWLNLTQMFPFSIDCFIDNMRLDYDNKTRTTSNSKGVNIRIPGWGDPFGVEYVDPTKSPLGFYFRDIGDMLVNDLGYTRNVSLRGAPYDFRTGPNSNERYFLELKDLIEETYLNNNNRRVTILAHSMGGPMSLIFLQRQNQAWKDKYINSLITLASPWGGSVKSLRVLATGDETYSLNPLVLREMLRTFPSLGWLLPSKIFWKDEDVLVQTDSRNYSLSDIQQYLIDIGAPNSWEFYKDNEKYLQDFRFPGVELYCFHGTKVLTTEKLAYKGVPKFQSAPIIIDGDGDGSVNLRSLEGCKRWTGEQNQIVHHQSFPGVDHMGILKDKNVLSYIKNTLTF